MWLWLLGTAIAQDTSEEVIVIGDPAVEAAKQAVIDELKHLGYDRKIVDKGDRVILRHEKLWRGKVVLHEDGFYEHERQGVKMTTPPVGGGDLDPVAAHALGAPLCIINPTACVRIGGLMVSKRKLAHEKTRTAQALQPSLTNWRDRIADARTRDTLEALPDRLENLWREGIPLLGDAPVPAWHERRAHLLEYWESRTDNAWGSQVRDAVAAFIRGEVMTSEHPFTRGEIEAFHARSTAAEPLVFVR